MTTETYPTDIETLQYMANDNARIDGNGNDTEFAVCSTSRVLKVISKASLQRLLFFGYIKEIDRLGAWAIYDITDAGRAHVGTEAPVRYCSCGAPLDADGTCPRETALDAGESIVFDDDTEEYPIDVLTWGNLRHSGIKWGLTGNEIRYTAENPLYDQPQPAPKVKMPRAFPDEVFMPDDYIPMDEY